MRISKLVLSDQNAMEDDLIAGRWASSLTKLDALEPRWAPAGGSPPYYLQFRAEALIGQGDWMQAKTLLDKAPAQAREDFPLTRDLVRALAGELDPDVAFAHAEHARLDFSSQGAPPPMERPTTIAEMAASVRLDRAVANRSSDLVAEREAREVLKVYPKQPIASYLLAKSLVYQKRGDESNPYWEAALVLPGSAGEEAMAVCHTLFPDRHEFDPPPPRTLATRSGPITPSLQAEIDRQRAFHEQFRRR